MKRRVIKAASIIGGLVVLAIAMGPWVGEDDEERDDDPLSISHGLPAG